MEILFSYVDNEFNLRNLLSQWSQFIQVTSQLHIYLSLLLPSLPQPKNLPHIHTFSTRTHQRLHPFLPPFTHQVGTYLTQPNTRQQRVFHHEKLPLPHQPNKTFKSTQVATNGSWQINNNKFELAKKKTLAKIWKQQNCKAPTAPLPHYNVVSRLLIDIFEWIKINIK